MLRALVREAGREGEGADGGRNGLLDLLERVGGYIKPSAGRIFYSRGNVAASAAPHTARVRALAESIAKGWKNAPQTIVVGSLQDPAVPQRVREYDAQQRSLGAGGEPEGFYYGGKVYLVASQLHSAADVQRVLAHETLGHAGLRGLYGDALNDILDQIIAARGADVKAKAKHYGLGNSRAEQRQAAEEVLATMAQEQPQLGFVRRAVAAVRTWLRANVPAFKGLALTDDEIARNWLAPARNFIERGRAAAQMGSAAPAMSRPVDEATDDLLQQYGEPVENVDEAMARQANGDRVFAFHEQGEDPTELTSPAEIDNFAPDQLLVLPRGASLDETPDARFSRAKEPNERMAAAKAVVNNLTSQHTLDGLLYNFQDKMIDLRRIQDKIRTLQGTVNDLNDAYQGETLYHGKVAKKSADFLRDELRPLLKAMHDGGVGMEELERYLHARHAPEANATLAERNPTAEMIDQRQRQARRQVHELAVQLESARAKGAATASLEQALQQAQEEAGRWEGAQAFKGTEAERTSLSGMSTADAQALLDSYTGAKRELMDGLADRVDAIQSRTLDELERYGLMAKSALDSWRAAYQHYVPLHRDEAHPDSLSHPIGQGFSVRGDASKRRVGSNAKVTHILSHIAMQREVAITRGEKNNVTKQLYILASQNPDPNVWTVDRAPTQRVLDRNGLARTQVDPFFKNKPNVLTVRIAGRDAFMVFNERNPQALRLAQSLKNLDVSNMSAFLSLMGKFTRYFAAINTQYNPIFGVVNIIRDAGEGAINLAATPLAGQQAKLAASILPAWRGIYKDLRANRQSADTNAWARLYEQFEQDGGKTGWRELHRDPGDRAKALARELRSLNRGQVSKAAHALTQWLSDYNETMENATRLSAYKLALDNGMSRPQAASLAKDLTINFNRKGARTRDMGALYAFFNAIVQGSTRAMRTLSSPSGKKIIAGGLALGAANALLGVAMMNAGGDNNWDKIPEFVKAHDLIIPLGSDHYVTVPYPLGYAAIPNAGRVMAEALMGKQSIGEAFLHIGGGILDSWNPLGGARPLAQIIAPTPLEIPVSLWTNTDWTGMPIAREDDNPLSPTPGYTRGKPGSSELGKEIAKGLNAVTGGNDYVPGQLSPTPDQVDYVFAQLTGGIGRELQHVDMTLKAEATGDELPPYRVPLVSHFYGSTEGQAGQAGPFYANVIKLNELNNQMRGLRHDGKGDEARRLHDSTPLATIAYLGAAVDKDVSKLRKERIAVLRQDGPDARERANALNARITELMTNLNNKVAQAQQ